MVARRVTPSDEPKSRRPPATTPEAEEQRLVLAAHDLAAKQLREGTASAQVITHFLKLGSTREKLEQQRLSGENKLLDAKIESMASQKRVEELYSAALNAMRTYAGQEPLEMPDD
jgi:hypothetical protein